MTKNNNLDSNKLLFFQKKFKSQLIINRSLFLNYFKSKKIKEHKLNKLILNITNYNTCNKFVNNFIPLNNLLLNFFFFITFKDILINNFNNNIFINKIKYNNINYFKVNDLIEFSFQNNFINLYLQKLINSNIYTFNLKKKYKFIKNLLYKKNINYKKVVSLFIYLNFTFNSLYSFDYKTFSIYINNPSKQELNKYNFNSQVLTNLTQLLN